MTCKKFLLVGYGVDKINWGNRGTSLALLSLLSTKGVVNGFIYAQEKNVRLGSFPVQKVSGKLSWELYNYSQKNIATRRGRISAFLASNLLEIGEYIKATPQDTAEFILKNTEKNPFFRSLVERVSSCDEVVINGEGDPIFTTPPRRTFLFLLVIAALASLVGKKTHFVNSVFSSSPNNTIDKTSIALAKETLRSCSTITVRDPMSLDFVSEHLPEISALLVPDALFIWNHYYFKNLNNTLSHNKTLLFPFLDSSALFNPDIFFKPYVAIAGSSRIEGTTNDAISSFSSLISEIKSRGIEVVCCQPGTGDEILRTCAKITSSIYIDGSIPIMAAATILSNAECFISGRYHPSILASCGGTPCIFLGSNSHKNIGLQKLLDYKSPHQSNCPPNATDIFDIVQNLDAILGNQSQRNSIYSKTAQLAQQVQDFFDLYF